MKPLHHVYMLRWFFLLWLLGVTICWNIWSWTYFSQSVPFHSLVTLLIILHAGIYWIELTHEMKRWQQWLFLCLQAVLVLLLIQISHVTMFALLLSPLLFITVTILLKRFADILIFIGCVILIIQVYVQTIGLSREWSDIWGGGYAPGVAVLGLFFLIALLLYLQQIQQAHERTLTLLHELDTAHAQLSAYALRVEELTMLTERQRIARDLHDTLVQGVAGLLMQLDVVHTQLQHQKIERAQRLLKQVIEATGDVLADARCAIGDLRTGHIRPDDLVEVLQEEISRFTASTDIPCHTSISALSATPAAYCEHVFRAISEGLTNIAHHAQASTVWVQAHCHTNMLSIKIQDNGLGFEPEKVNVSAGHYGLLGIRERARLTGGSLQIESVVGQGTTLSFHIPAYDRQERSAVCHTPFASLSLTTT